MSKKKGTPGAGKTSRSKARKAQKKKKKGPSGTIRILLVAFGIVLVATAYLGWSKIQPAPEVVHPLDEASLDPAVGALLAPMIAAVESDPRDAALHAELGMAYEANTLWPEARRSYENAILLKKSEMPWVLHHAIATREEGMVEEAAALLQEAADLFPGAVSVQHRLAESLLEAGDLDKAEQAFQRVVSLASRLPQGYVGLGDINTQKGNAASAIQFLETAIELQKDYRLAYYVLGQAYRLAGRDEEADAALARGIDASVTFIPDPLTRRITGYVVNATGRLDMAQAYLDSGNPSEAASLLEETYRYHASNVMLLNTLGVAYLRMDQKDDAFRLFDQARQIDEQTFYTYLNLYQWALRAGKKESALAFADSAIAKAPERDDTHLARAQALTELGRFDEAVISATHARENGPQKAANFGLSGEISFRMSRWKEAEEFYTRAVELDAGLALAWLGLAKTNRELGDMRMARQMLSEAQRVAPGHPGVARLKQEFATMR